MKPRMRVAAGLLALAALAACEREFELPGGGSLTLDPEAPVNPGVAPPEGDACIETGLEGKTMLTARQECRPGEGMTRRR